MSGQNVNDITIGPLGLQPSLCVCGHVCVCVFFPNCTLGG